MITFSIVKRRIRNNSLLSSLLLFGAIIKETCLKFTRVDDANRLSSLICSVRSQVNHCYNCLPEITDMKVLQGLPKCNKSSDKLYLTSYMGVQDHFSCSNFFINFSIRRLLIVKNGPFLFNQHDFIIVINTKPLFSIAIAAVIMMLVGFSMATGNGFYIFQIFDDYAATLPLLIIALFQCIAVAWVYGNDRYAQVCMCLC